ncbi:ATPase [Pseudomonas sp. SWRI153]|uniref:ATPase n=1 Tax=Pseudomonas khorasanensis TaxID=2745508 RepID=A0A923FAA6_9PSED|nr:ATPase [Pseudomonas khorasanensis]MBV4488902.1 ATPase [Pseudomonas khorasanensis]
MKPARPALLAISVLMLCACSVPTAPNAVSSLDTLLPHPTGRSNATQVNSGPDVSLGVIYSPSTQANRQYLRDYQANAGTGFGQSLLVQPIHDAYVASSSPDRAVEWVNASLQRQFGSVTVYPDMQSLRAAKPDVVAIVDTHSQLITSRSSDIRAEVSADFYDAQLNYIGTAKGSEARELTPVWADFKRSEEIVADINQQEDVQVQALREFDRSLGNLVARPVEKVSMLDSQQVQDLYR